MAKSNTKIVYDKEEDILNLSKGSPSQASIEIGDFVLDIDFNGYVSAIEILNASENLNISKEMLENVEKACMRIVYKPNYLFVALVFNLKGVEKDIRIPLTVDLGHRQVQKQEICFAR
ncbi:MAG: DUF2283 domain-containing protein [Nanoarchaeota archaeon]|nr:DUF2283 domain-containing protein [Nanoarchaeota archaeon]